MSRRRAADAGTKAVPEWVLTARHGPDETPEQRERWSMAVRECAARGVDTVTLMRVCYLVARGRPLDLDLDDRAEVRTWRVTDDTPAA